MKKVAITGGLASGKSSVCSLLCKFGAYVASADEIVHHLLSPNTSIGKKVIDLLGPDIVKNDSLDRQKIAQKIFQNKALLKSLENLLHPAVFQEIERQYQMASKRQEISLFVAEVPLLFEAGYGGEFDFTIAVVADPELCKKRYKGFSCDDDYEARMSNQWSMAQKAAKADGVIVNNGDLKELEEQVRQVFNHLSKT